MSIKIFIKNFVFVLWHLRKLQFFFSENKLWLAAGVNDAHVTDKT